MSELTIRTTRTGHATTTTATPFTGLGLGEVTSPNILRAQTARVEALAEQVQMLQSIIRGWSAGLADRLSGASWGTAQINAAAEGVQASVGDPDAFTDHLAGLAGACHAAMSVGAEAEAKEATGSAESFRPA